MRRLIATLSSLLVPLLVALAVAVDGIAIAANPPAKQAPAADNLVLGTFPLKEKNAVIDGDTIKVKGLDASLRLLCIDTEEIYHHAERRELARKDFAGYAKAMRGDGPPAKFGTPMGVAAHEWAKRFFKDVKEVRLEYDERGRARGYYGRHLVYVFARKKGRWINYNLEAVRMGMAPYFVKYGRCRRFDAAFGSAQAQARAAHRGIWGDKVPHYVDYDERLDWWASRAKTIDRFRDEVAASDHAVLIDLLADDGLTRAKAHVGETITVFSSFGDSRLKKKPYLVPLSHRRNEDFLIVAFNDAELAKLELSKWKGKLVHVRGKVSQYRGRPQMKAADVKRIWVE